MIRRIAWALAVLGLPTLSMAGDYMAGGLTFSDENGGMVITGVGGTGSKADPYVVREEIHGDGVAILTIKGLHEADQSMGLRRPLNEFTLLKIVTNRTPHPWRNFEMELRELRTRRSDYGDGLSFGQALGEDRVFASDMFSDAFLSDEPIDALTFHGGTVNPGETVQFRLRITDYSPRWEFYLFQRHESPMAMAPSLRAAGASGAVGRRTPP